MSYTGPFSAHREGNILIPGGFLTSNIIFGANSANFTIGNSVSTSVAGFAAGDFGLVHYCVGNNATGLVFPAGWNLVSTLSVTNGTVGGTVYSFSRVMQAGDVDPVFSRSGGTGNIIATLQSFRNMRQFGVLNSVVRNNLPDAAQQFIPGSPNLFLNSRALVIAIKSAPDVVGWASLSGTAPNYNFGGSTWNEGAESGGQWSVYLAFGQVLTRSASGLLLNRGSVPGICSIAQFILA